MNDRRKEERVSTTVRLPRSLLNRLDAQAYKRVLGRNLLVTRAVEDLVERLEADS